MLNSIVCVLCLYVLWLSAVSGQHLNQIFTSGVNSQYELYDGSATEDVVGNTYQVVAFSSQAQFSIGGVTLVNEGGYDTALVKYDPLGNVQWVRALQTPGYEEFFQVTTDPAGNVYAVGWTDTSQNGISIDGSWDGILAKYDTNGNLLYLTNQYSHVYFQGQQDIISNVVYSNNYLYLFLMSAQQIYYVFQTDVQGVVQWTYKVPTYSLNAQPTVFQMAVDPLRNNLYLAGQLYGSFSNSISNGKTVTGFSSQYWDGFLYSISTSGFAQWIQPQQTNGGDNSYAVVVDASGYVYVGGCISGSVDGQAYSGSGCNAFVQKYDWNGNRQWTRIYQQYPGYGTTGLVVDNSGSLYTRIGNNNYQYILQTDTNGNVLWSEGLPGGTSPFINCNDILPYGWCRPSTGTYLDSSGALTLSGLYSNQFFGWTSNNWAPYVSKWQLNISCAACAQFDSVLGQLQALLNVAAN